MTDINQDLLRRLQPLFQQAVALPEPQRASFVGEACGSDPGLRRLLLELLAADQVAGGLLEPPGVLVDAGRQSLSDSPIAQPEKIGDFLIKQVIATGGMGVVYLARQQHPGREVALKVMRAGLVSAVARRRFQYEVEILAQFNHPAVARIYGAGFYEQDGQSLPFFVMEYIAGARSITEFAALNQLGVWARVEQFVEVCEAVDSGHQRGIIHRDLKPDNILVDEKGRVHIIDFGVARATGRGLQGATLLTCVGQFVGTLQYMSPEQCAADPGALDTRSDVYALGVVLYELLAGRVPYDLQGMSLAEGAQVILQRVPMNLHALNPSLDTDLATVVERALEKDPARRYRSAGAMADDLQRYLKAEPILARRPSLIYQLRVTARRHKALTTAAFAGVLALGLGFFGTSLGLRQARHERDRALEALAFGFDIIQSVSTALAQGERVPDSVVVRAAEWLDGGACRGQPDLEADFRTTVGRAFVSLGRGNLAEPHLGIALDLVRRRAGPESAEAAAALEDLARARSQMAGESESLARQALGIRRRVLGLGHEDTLRSLEFLAGILTDQGRTSEAEPLLEDAIEIRSRRGDDEHANVARDLGLLGYCRFSANDYASGESLLRRAMDRQRQLLAPTHLDLARTTYSLAHLCMGKSDYAEAERLFRETLGILNVRLVEDHYWSGNVRRLLAEVLLERGALAEAEVHYRQLLDSPGVEPTEPGMKEAMTRSGWGECLCRGGRYAEAEHQLLLARRLIDELGGDDPENLQWKTTRRLAVLYAQRGKPDQAAACLRSALPDLRRRVADGEDRYRRAISAADLGVCLTLLGDYPEAERTLLDAFGGYSAKAGVHHPEMWRILDPIVALYQAWGRPDQAAQWRARGPASDVP